jgi:AcrR family transcriptional regulator
MSETSRVGEQRPGGRSARVRAAILEAVFDLIAEVGYDAVSVEEVADRAGVHKTTVYRRWPSKAELVLDATLHFSARTIPIPDTGSLRGDLRALARSVVANIGADTGARRSLSIVAATASSPELAASLHRFWAERLTLTEPIVERAIARGELPVGTDPNAVIEAVVGPLWMRLMLTGEPIDADVADRIVDLVAPA